MPNTGRVSSSLKYGSTPKDPFVGGELLQRSYPGTGAHDRHQIPLPHVVVYKLLECAAHVIRAFKRETEVVGHQDDGAFHLLRRQGPRWRQRDCGGILDGRGRPACRLRTGGLHVGERRDLLRPAVFANVEVIGSEIRYLLPMGIGDHRVHLDQVHADAQIRAPAAPPEGCPSAGQEQALLPPLAPIRPGTLPQPGFSFWTPGS